MNHDHSHGMGKHILLMLLCCLVPLGLIFAVSTFGLSLGPLQSLLPFALVLLCPLMMTFMMKDMMQPNGGMDHSQHHGQTARLAARSHTAEAASSGKAEPAAATPESGKSLPLSQ